MISENDKRKPRQESFLSCISLAAVSIGTANPEYSSEDGVLFDKTHTKLLRYPPGKSERSYSVPAGVTEIAAYAFTHCFELASVRIPAGVTHIGTGAFSGCTGLSAIDVDAANPGYSSEDGVLFDKTQTRLLCYPAGKSGEFYPIPNRVTTIGERAFYSCGRLTSVCIPAGVTAIEAHAFTLCSRLTFADIPGKVTKIGKWAFAQCDNLSSVSIPGSVTTIAPYAFAWCGRLTSLSIPGSVPAIANDELVNCFTLSSIRVDASNPAYSSEEGVLLNKRKTRLLCYPAGKSGGYSIPGSVTGIGNHAFACCRRLTDLSLSRRMLLSASDHTDDKRSPDSCTLLAPAGNTTFEDTPLDSCTLHVPAGTKAFYEEAPVWKNFGTIKESVR